MLLNNVYRVSTTDSGHQNGFPDMGINNVHGMIPNIHTIDGPSTFALSHTTSELVFQQMHNYAITG